MITAQIEVSGLAKRIGDVEAVRDATFVAAPGRVTGFLGPNGAGKSTTLRMLLGLARPDSGTAHRRPAVRRTRRPHRHGRGRARPRRCASGHDRSRAPAQLLRPRRARCRTGREVAELTGMSDTSTAASAASHGMRQRLSLATALLGDPDVLVLDEPSNGLDPAGIVWLRTFLREFAANGGTVLISSHVLTELQHGIDDLVLIDHGRTTWTGPLSEFTERGTSLEAAFLELTSGGASPLPAGTEGIRA